MFLFGAYKVVNPWNSFVPNTFWGAMLEIKFSLNKSDWYVLEKWCDFFKYKQIQRIVFPRFRGFIGLKSRSNLGGDRQKVKNYNTFGKVLLQVMHM